MIAPLDRVAGAVQGERIASFSPGKTCTLGLAGNAHERPCTVDLWRAFQPEVNLSFLGLRRLKVLAHASRSFPASQEMHFENSAARRWAIFFCYAPDGQVTPAHRFTIDRLRSEGFAVLGVCATPDPAMTRGFQDLGLDGLIWKALRGYDFSGYTLGLSALARRFNAVDVLVMNDSVVGPLHPLRPVLDSTPWDLTGFMTSYSVEHHIQSFAFYLKGFGQAVVNRYRRVFLRHVSFDAQGPVSLLQETRLGSALVRKVTVGSILEPSAEYKHNYYLLGNPKGLLDAGFPFLKRSIFGKFAEGYDQNFYRACLEEHGHPVVV